MRRPGFEADKKDIILYNLKTGARQNLTAAFPDTIASFVFGADEKTIYFIASESIYEPIFKLQIASKKIEKIVPAVNANSLQSDPGRQVTGLPGAKRDHAPGNFQIRPAPAAADAVDPVSTAKFSRTCR